MDDTPIADATVDEGGATEIPIAPATVADTIEDGAGNKDEAASSGLKDEDPTTIAEMMEDAEAAATAAGSDFVKETVEESAVVPPPAVEDNKNAPAGDATPTDVKEEISEAKEGNTEDQAGEPTGTMAADKAEPPTETATPAKETKKRVRRVGRTPTRKIPKLEEKIAAPALADAGDDNNTQVAADTVDAATATIGAVPEVAGTVAMDVVAQPPANQGVLSKHDEKWHAMFQKLMEFKERNKHTLVPQCYTEDPRLGRWVHYQRVEYWIFQQKGTAKITEERIARLNHIGFEWDPQKAQWEKMFAKLKEFKKEFSHCRVPKGYDKDWELANWVRNQRLEQANLSKEGKKSRMTPERFKLLDDLGFKWSSPTPARARRNRQVPKKVDGSTTNEEQKVATTNGATLDTKTESDAPADAPAIAPPVVAAADPTTTNAGKPLETTDPAQTEAMTAATNVVGNLPAVEASVNEENHGFVQDAIEGKTTDEEKSKTDAPAAAAEVPLVENENSVVALV